MSAPSKQCGAYSEANKVYSNNNLLKGVSYNVAGLKTMIQDHLFRNFLQQFDIFILLETFIIKERDEFIGTVFSDLSLQWG